MVGAASGPVDTERARTLWFALLLTLTNGFLDAHTYMARGHVFANVQTANVIFSAIDVSERQFAAALAHVWPLLAFIAGMLLASHIKSGRMERIVPHSLRWTMGVQAVALGDHRLRPGLGGPQLRHGADLVSRGRADRPVPQHRRPGVSARRHDRKPDAIHGSRPTTASSRSARRRVARSWSTAP